MIRAALSRVSPSTRHVLLGLVLLVAVVGRVGFLRAGVPFAVGIDEPAIVDRALRILRTGDWNTHIFDYPPFVIYVHAVVFIVRFLGGAVGGEWASLAAFDIAAVYTAGRFVAAAIGVATVWMVYRTGREVESTAVGLLAAAQLAVIPIHVRESHFILTDVPVTALTTAAVWMAARAASVRTPGAYARGGAICGLAAAAKYNGVVALVPLVAVWIAVERGAPGRWRKIAVGLVSAAIAFVLASPYTMLDLPTFLNGFAAQASRFAATHTRYADPTWLLYMKHLSLAGRWWLPLALLGGIAALARRRSRVPWLPVTVFALAYFYVLASHPLVFARYALPLVPMVCLLAANAAAEAVALVARALPGRPYARRAAFALAAVALVAGFTYQSAGWLDQFRRTDTRQIAAEWMSAHLPRGTRLLVENSGPTYLTSAGFTVAGLDVIGRRPVETYAKEGFEYLVISSVPALRDPAYAAVGPVVYEVAPSPVRWGPQIRIIRIGG